MRATKLLPFAAVRKKLRKWKVAAAAQSVSIGDDLGSLRVRDQNRRSHVAALAHTTLGWRCIGGAQSGRDAKDDLATSPGAIVITRYRSYQ